MPSLACAAAHAGNLEVLQALVELVRPLPLLGDQPQPCQSLGARRTAFPWGPAVPGWAASWQAAKGPTGAVPGPTPGVHPDPSHPLSLAYLTLPSAPSAGDRALRHPRAVT